MNYCHPEIMEKSGVSAISGVAFGASRVILGDEFVKLDFVVIVYGRGV